MARDPDQPSRTEIMARPSDNTTGVAQYRHITYSEVTGSGGEVKHAMDVNIFGTIVLSAGALSTESTLVQILTATQSLSSYPFARETTLSNALSVLQSISSINFATASIQSQMLTALQSLSGFGFATESTLVQTLSELSTLASTVNNGRIETNLGISGTAVSNSNPMPVAGNAAVGGALGNPVTIAMKDFASGLRSVPATFQSAGIDIQIVTQFDASFNTPDYTANGEIYGLVASTDGTKTNATYIRLDSNKAIHSVGNVAHDATDTSNPIKIGSRAAEYEPTTSGALGFSDVAVDARVDLALNRKGQLITGVKAEYQNLTGINTVYETTTAITSSTFEIWNYKELLFSYDLTVTGTPTDITFQLWISDNGSTYRRYRNGFWGLFILDDVAGASDNSCVNSEINGQKAYILVQGSGVSSTSSFALTNCSIYLRD